MFKIERVKENKTTKAIYFTKDSNIFKNNKSLEISIYYSLGGYSLGGYSQRGYYISLEPCKLGNNSVTSYPFDGIRYFLKEVNRQSKRQFNEAIKSVTFETLSVLSAHMGFSLSDKELDFILKSIQDQFID